MGHRGLELTEYNNEDLLSEINRLKSIAKTTLDPEKIFELNKRISELEKKYESGNLKEERPEP